MTSIEPVQRADLGTSDKTGSKFIIADAYSILKWGFVLIYVLILAYNTTVSTDSNVDEYLKLKGQMMYVKEWDCIIFLATPV